MAAGFFFEPLNGADIQVPTPPLRGRVGVYAEPPPMRDPGALVLILCFELRLSFHAPFLSC